MRTIFAAVCVLALANAAFAQKGAYVPANIVETWDKCPVKNPTSWDPKVFDSSIDSLTALADLTNKLSKSCQDALMSLSECAMDNDVLTGGTVTSLSTSDGCCLTACSDSIKKTVAAGCFDNLLKEICGNPAADKYKTGLFNAGMRCANFAASCPSNATATAKAALNATATAVAGKAANATAAVKGAVTAAAANATAAVKGAAADATAAVAGAAAKLTNGAAATAASAAAVVIGAAAMLML